MKNLLQRIRGWFVVEDKVDDTNLYEQSKGVYFGPQIISEALDHYCPICKRAWETVRAAKAHKRIKHEGGKSNLPHLTSPQ